MATYTYKCTNEKCNHRFETKQSMMDDKLVTCPECGQETLQRVITASPVHFKGGNWVTPGQK
jgi:putative FmdB family regulatory protein